MGLEYSLLAFSIILVLTGISLFLKEVNEKLKIVLFSLIALVALSNTFILVSSTIALNSRSVTSGPVHYHADFEVWRCGEKLDIVDPEGLSNRVGTPLVHEHGDNRIHIEGVLLEELEASLGYFFKAIGGNMTKNSLALPTNNGFTTLKDGDLCSDGKKAILQVFVLNLKDGKVTQRKLTNPVNYVISPNTKVPPGDCIILEFDLEKPQTPQLCQSYKSSVQEGVNNGN